MNHDTLVERIESAGRMVSIHHDTDPMSPADWDHAGTILLSPSRQGTIPTADEVEPSGRMRPDDWEVDARYLERFKGALVFPLDIYWDWNPTVRIGDDYQDADGIVYLTSDELAEEWNGDRAAAESYLRARINELNQYLQGDVYCYEVADEAGNVLDSCGSFYGLDYCRDEARGAALENAAPTGAQLAALLLPL